MLSCALTAAGWIPCSKSGTRGSWRKMTCIKFYPKMNPIDSGRSYNGKTLNNVKSKVDRIGLYNCYIIWQEFSLLKTLVSSRVESTSLISLPFSLQLIIAGSRRFKRKQTILCPQPLATRAALKRLHLLKILYRKLFTMLLWSGDTLAPLAQCQEQMASKLRQQYCYHEMVSRHVLLCT